MPRTNTGYTHGATGTKPSGVNFETGDYPDPEQFDWFWDTVSSAIDDHASEFTRLDSDNDGVVDEADYANDADASTYKGADIDSDGDGIVDEADTVQGSSAQELSERGSRVNLPSKTLVSGDYINVVQYPSLPTGTELAVRRAVVSNDAFGTPSGLTLRVVDGTGSTIRAYTGYNDVDETYSVGGQDIAVVVDNGHYGNGTGSEQVVTAELAFDLR